MKEEFKNEKQQKNMLFSEKLYFTTYSMNKKFNNNIKRLPSKQWY